MKTFRAPHLLRSAATLATAATVLAAGALTATPAHAAPAAKLGDVVTDVRLPFPPPATKAKTTFTGWSKKTITVKPGGRFTLPAIAIGNPGGPGNLALLEEDLGFGWVCASGYGCDDPHFKVSSNATEYKLSMRFTPKPRQTLTTKYRYRVLSNDLVTGGTSPVITVKFTKGIAKSKATKTVLTISGTQKYGKKQATLKATVKPTPASNQIVNFQLYKKLAHGGYEWVTANHIIGGFLKKGKATFKFPKRYVKKGSYVVVAVFRSEKPRKYRDSVSKPVKLTVR